MRTMSKASLAVLGVVVIALALAGCGSAAKPKVQFADGVALTAADTKLTFGQGATVLARSRAGVSSPVAITVTGVKLVSPALLAAYGLATMTPPVTPYFVYVKVTNVGKHDLGGGAIPLYLQDTRNVLVNHNAIRPRFATCPSESLPKSFGSGATVTTCLIYLLPQHDPAMLVSYRPIQTVGPITWSGSIVGQSPSAKPTK